MNKVLISIVLYQTELQDSLTYQSFIQHKNTCSFEFDLLIINNSPETLIKENADYIVYHSKKNIKLAGAYNQALQIAKEKNINWLLLLDQDTSLNKNYFLELNSFFSSQKHKEYTVAIPYVFSKEKQVSPLKYHPLLGPFAGLKEIKGNTDKHICLSAFNSGTLINTDFLKNHNGFSEKYPLDYLDYWLFYLLYKEEKNIFLLNAKINQHLSVFNYSSSVNKERYLSILKAESLFAKELGKTAQFIYSLRKIARIINQSLIPEKRPYASLTFYSIFKTSK